MAQLHPLTGALRAALPADHPALPTLADLLLRLAAARLPADWVALRLTHDPELWSLLAALAGQRVSCDGLTIHFGDFPAALTIARSDDDVLVLAPLDLLEARGQSAAQEGNLAALVQRSLLAATIRSQRDNLSPMLLTGLVAVGSPAGRWSAETALAHMREMSDPRQHVGALQRLLETSPLVPPAAALAFARTIQAPRWRIGALASVVPHLTGAQQKALCAEIIDLVSAIAPTTTDDMIALALVHYLPRAWLPAVLHGTRQMDARWHVVIDGLPAALRPRLHQIAQAITSAWLPIAAEGRRAPRGM